jgi:predicted metal-dependent hydrolase
MKPRNPQLTLRLDLGVPDAGERWRDGAELAYLGTHVRLSLDSACPSATLENGVLRLPLPPQATTRQIRDSAETWLQSAILRLLETSVARLAAQRGLAAPRCTLSFAARAHWVLPDGKGGLRCNWRLVEHSPAMIEQILAQALGALAQAAAPVDLFSCSA